MSIIDSKKLNQALARAKNIGVVELSCTISGCDLVFRSLRSEDYTAALQDCDGLPEEAYIPRYQKGHIARAIVEVNGVDLRTTQFVTVDEPDKVTGGTKKVKLELHKYLTDQMLNTWGKEAVDVAFRKLGEVLELAERRAKEGVTFIAPDETGEEKYRRLLLETRAAEKDLPMTLLDKILEEQGLMRTSTADEIKRVMSRTDQLAREQEAKDAPKPPEVDVVEPEEPAEPEAADEGSPPPEVVQTPPARPRAPVADPHVTLQQAIAARRPPEVKSEQNGEAKPSPTRAAQIAALEGSEDSPADVASAVYLQEGSDDVVEIRQVPIDPDAVSLIVDNPPVVGINPRFRPPQRA